MDPQPQLLLSIYALLIGVGDLLPRFDHVNIPLLFGLSWLAGWSILFFTEMLLILIGRGVSIPPLLLIPVCLVSLSWFRRPAAGPEHRVRIPHPVRLVLSLALFTALFAMLAYAANFHRFSPDSLANDGLSAMFHQFGRFVPDDSTATYWLLNARLPFYVGIHSIGKLFGIHLYYTFISATTVFVFMSIIGAFLCISRPQKTNFIFPIATITCIYFSNKLILFHSFYHLSNLTTMAYFSVAILCICLFMNDVTNNKNQIIFFILGCLFLGISCIIRKEMLLFSLIPFIFLFFHRRPTWKTLIIGYSTYLLSGYLWHVYGVTRFHNDWMTSGTHGGTNIIFFMLMISFIIFFSPWLSIKKWVMAKYSLILIGVLFLLCLFLFLLDLPMRKPFWNLIELMFSQSGQWGPFWYFVFLFLLLFIYLSFNKKFSSILFSNFTTLSFIFFNICVFLFLRWLLYAIFDQPSDQGWNSSGNRLLLHIVPICAFFMGLFVNQLLYKLPFNKNLSLDLQ